MGQFIQTQFQKEGLNSKFNTGKQYLRLYEITDKSYFEKGLKNSSKSHFDLRTYVLETPHHLSIKISYFDVKIHK